MKPERETFYTLQGLKNRGRLVSGAPSQMTSIRRKGKQVPLYHAQYTVLPRLVRRRTIKLMS